MPALPEPEREETLCLPSRTARIGGTADVLVVGGGPAGLGAAIGAASAGARVILAERYGFLGGSATASLVIHFGSYHTHSKITGLPRKFSLLPKDHGRGRQVIAGVVQEFVDLMVKKRGALSPSLVTGYTVPFDPEVFKRAAAELIDRHGILVLLHALASGTTADPRAVIFETKSGPVAIQARVIVDCTGDGDVAAASGAKFGLGRVEDGLTQPMTLIFRVGNFNRDSFKKYAESHPEEWDGVKGLTALLEKARKETGFTLSRKEILFFGSFRNEIAVNSTRVTHVFGTNVWDLTKAEWQSRRQMERIFGFLKKYVPGFENSYLVQSGVQVGVRESRRIAGEYELTEDDIREARHFEDVVARCSYPFDLHSPTGKGTFLKNIPEGSAYDIPLRCLLPRGIEGMLVAGRCISGTHTALSSYRIIPTAMATGQAAGVCAALAAKKKISVHSVPHEEVQKELLRQGAILS